jgi:nucleotide-binding universal stress UspA family protein
MTSRILVPTDFTAQSDAALTYARLFARTFNASLHLMHVTATNSPPPHAAAKFAGGRPAAMTPLRDRITDEDRRRLITVRVVEGTDPAGPITRYAETTNAGLIVMGTHGRGGIARLVMGSVAETVVRTAPCPVLTVHAAPRSSVVGIRRILVPTDFSAASDAAFDWARVLGSRFAAPVHLLHVLPEINLDGGRGSEDFVTESPEARSLRLADARERLTHRLPTDARTSPRITTEVVFGAPAKTIEGYAADNGFDLIVMGTHGRTGIAHLLEGSVAERVVRGAASPVMTIRGGCHVESMVPGMDPVRATA